MSGNRAFVARKKCKSAASGLDQVNHCYSHACHQWDSIILIGPSSQQTDTMVISPSISFHIVVAT
jgi:hypothetical protein